MGTAVALSAIIVCMNLLKSLVIISDRGGPESCNYTKRIEGILPNFRSSECEVRKEVFRIFEVPSHGEFCIDWSTRHAYHGEVCQLTPLRILSE